MITQLSDASFEADVLNGAMPTVVVFTAEWCGPCRLLQPVLEEVARELSNQVRFGTLDIDAQPATPTTYELKAVPTLMLFNEGVPVAAKMGALTREQIIAWLVGLKVIDPVEA